MATEIKAIERAAEIGREHREAFVEEFGADPVVGEIGDWDATGWAEAWRELSRDLDGPADPEYQDRYAAGRAAYLKALFATEAVG
jgi:hypothetical protein